MASPFDNSPKNSPRIPPRPTMAGGFPIAAGAMLGAGGGFFIQEATRGFLIGAGVGAVIAIAIWLIDRLR